MVNRQALLSDLQKLLARLEADLLDRSESADVPEVGRKLRAEYERARGAERTAQNYEDWRSDAITQAAAAWVLSCVFVRFLEDNALIDPPNIAGPNDRLQRARDEHELYFRVHARETDREYLLAVFDELATLPGTKDVFGEHNPFRELPNWLSGDAAGELLQFFQKIDANTGALVHDFTDAKWDTRFLGDLYQDLSEAARKKYALLQTPEFVEEFILDRTLDPALEEFGLDATALLDNEGNPGTETGFRMIDPACGSGHFLLGAFPRILDRWQRIEPASNVRELVQRTLDSLYGVDVNPYAVAIARVRLLLSAMRACHVNRLADAPGFRLNLVCGDSLMHGSPGGDQQLLSFHELAHVYQSEDLPALRRILTPGTYHAVVANPPYITVKDKALNQAYRERYPEVCHRQYSLSVPFIQRLVDLACANGFAGQITSNSFMKREFGKKLVEQYIPTWDLTHVIDTQCVHIPEHGTGTVILFGRSRTPVGAPVRLVSTLKNEEPSPPIPQLGKVWLAVTSQVDWPGSNSAYATVVDADRSAFNYHPWSIGGGGAAELKEVLDVRVEATTLANEVDEIGFGCVTRDDDAFVVGLETCRRNKIARRHIRDFVTGENVRDWVVQGSDGAIWPYDANTLEALCPDSIYRVLWRFRPQLGVRSAYGQTQLERGLFWFEYSMFFRERFRSRRLISFAAVTTHNSFVVLAKSPLCNRHAPVIKLRAGFGEDEHIALLGVLNSSTACFWMKQVFFDKGGGGIGGGISAEAWERRFEFDGTKLQQFPLPADRPLELARQIEAIARAYSDALPDALCRRGVPDAAALAHAREQTQLLRRQMIAMQEELDWHCYELYGLIPQGELTACRCENPSGVSLGQRPFEIVLARQMAAGELETTWFTRHGSTPITEIPSEWSADFRAVVQSRIDLIERDKNIGLIEKPEYKRRWNAESWDEQQERALRRWLLGRLESYFDFDGRMKDESRSSAKLDIALVSIVKLADIAMQDREFQQVGELYRDDAAFDVQTLVAELIAAENVPLLPILRYKPSGLRKRAAWESTWDLQRREDAGDDVGTIAIPPKYTSADFISTGGARYWALRGKLDVPKERWVSFPHCEGPDGTLVIAWAGYDHLQLARAISEYYVRVQTELGGSDDPRLVPLLAGVVELLPWLKQWHNEPDAAFNGLRMGDYFESFVTEEARNLNKTIEEIKSWTPPARTTGRRRSRTTN